MTLLEELIHSTHPAVTALINGVDDPKASWDNKPSWDNWKRNPGPWGNQPSWDNWRKR
jgi:hypothetical protein